ncbi:hypothetical protein H4Q26_010164 [Puccinia striiformis f. sp. tritici PST-130]|nr:hypothetical protein H4Q26_010164 [Puccinia striiformis f. sp. tritici PST-130]
MLISGNLGKLTNKSKSSQGIDRSIMAQVRISDPGIRPRDGGLAELQDSWNDGRIQFAFVRVKEAGSGLTKFVLIAWCGDGVLESRKGLFHSHASTVAQFLKGYHVQINARCDADVEPSHILKRVADSSGAKYSVHNEKPVKREMPAPVGTNYKPIGRPDIASMTSKQKPTPPAPVGTSYTPRKNELAEIRAARTAPSAAPVPARAPVNRYVNEDDFEPTIKATFTPPQPAIPARPLRLKPQHRLRALRKTKMKDAPVMSGPHTLLYHLGNQESLETDCQPSRHLKSDLKAVVIYDYEQADTDEMGLVEGETIINIEQVDEGWWTGMSADGTRQGLFPATCVRLITEETEANQAEAIAPEAEEEVVEEEEVTATSTPAADKGVHAIAMYDYEAGEDNEIKEIIEIEYSSEDWWTGTVASSGQRGLFPANYVELQEQ